MDHLMEGFGLASKLRQWKAISCWESAVGEKLAGNTKPVRVQNGVIWLQSTGPQWAAEVSMRKREILDILNQKVGLAPDASDALKDIRFVGSWESRKP